jgi:hypothetical protein
MIVKKINFPSSIFMKAKVAGHWHLKMNFVPFRWCFVSTKAEKEHLKEEAISVCEIQSFNMHLFIIMLPMVTSEVQT